MSRPPQPDDAAPVHRLNLNLLYPLDAILHAPTLTEAGRRVHLSQSAMSHALRRLRDHFGDDLVTHAGGDQQLTPLGQALRNEVRRVMREVEGTFSYTLNFDPLTATDAITIAAPEAIEQMLLGPVLRRLSQEGPFLRVTLMELDTEDPRRSIDEGADLLLLPEEAAVAALNLQPKRPSASLIAVSRYSGGSASPRKCRSNAGFANCALSVSAKDRARFNAWLWRGHCFPATAQADFWRQ